MPDRGEVNSITSASASSEVTKQVEAFHSQRSTSPASVDVPILSEGSSTIEPVEDFQSEEIPDEYLAQNEDSPAEPLAEDDSPPETATEDNLLSSETSDDLATSQLELLPPSADSQNSTPGFDDSEAGAGDATSEQALREELSRKEEELINQQQQNEYLEKRLQELENQLAQSREGAVKDENLASMEERLREERVNGEQVAAPKVVSTPVNDEPWYKRFSLWLLGGLVIVAAAAGWLMSRRGGSDTVVSDLDSGAETLRKFKDDTKSEVREAGSASAETGVAVDITQEKDSDEASVAEAEGNDAEVPEDTQSTADRKTLSEQGEDARVLDEESADPEIQLDLARAYISMGDREAARVILEEVIANGSEEQQAEANSMKDLL